MSCLPLAHLQNSDERLHSHIAPDAAIVLHQRLFLQSPPMQTYYVQSALTSVRTLETLLHSSSSTT